MIVLCNVSSLAVTRIEKLAKLLVSNRAQGFYLERLNLLEVPSSREAHAIADYFGLPLPLHVLCTHASDLRHTKSVVCHLWTSPIPPESIVYLANGVYACIPEFSFVQLCCGSDRENRLMLGSELAAKYAVNPKGRKGLITRPPLVTPKSIEAFASQIPQAPGAARALEVAPYIGRDARSPKENELWLIFRLPRTLGGRSISSIEMDRKIELNAQARKLAKRSCLYSDLFFLLSGTDFEYDADDNHLTKTANESDKRRANALRIVDIDLITMTNGQLHDWQSFDIIARQMEEREGRIFRTTSEATRARQEALWERLILGVRSSGKTEVVRMSLTDRMARTSALDSY